MLKKLIKYDLKYGAKIFIVIHALLWIAAIFGRVFFLDRIDFDAPTEQLVSVLVLFFSAFVLLFSVVSLATALLIAARFYKNLLDVYKRQISWSSSFVNSPSKSIVQFSLPR